MLSFRRKLEYLINLQFYAPLDIKWVAGPDAVRDPKSKVPDRIQFISVAARPWFGFSSKVVYLVSFGGELYYKDNKVVPISRWQGAKLRDSGEYKAIVNVVDATHKEMVVDTTVEPEYTVDRKDNLVIFPLKKTIH